MSNISIRTLIQRKERSPKFRDRTNTNPVQIGFACWRQEEAISKWVWDSFGGKMKSYWSIAHFWPVFWRSVFVRCLISEARHVITNLESKSCSYLSWSNDFPLTAFFQRSEWGCRFSGRSLQILCTDLHVHHLNWQLSEVHLCSRWSGHRTCHTGRFNPK